MFIRVLPNQLVLPAYLHWFINLATTQQKMNAFARGTTIRMISAESMEGLELELPTLDRQQKIVAAVELNRQIVLTQTQLTEKRQRYNEEILLLYAKGSQHLDRS
jgi:restriction endonuclease S subunit